MSYVLDNLLKNERVVYEARVHWSVYLSWKSLLTLFIWGWIQRTASEFAVTNRRVMIKVGIVQRRTLELNLGKVESIEVEQSIWGRLFSFGDIEVIGTGGTRELFQRIGDPIGFRKAVAEAAEAHHDVHADSHAAPGAAAASLAAADPQERLAKAQEMLDKGLISPEEFAQVRQRILAEM